MKTSKFTDSHIMAILKQAESLAHLLLPFVVNTVFYKWRAKYGGMHTSLLARMKVLEYVVRKGKAKFLN